MTKKKRDKKKKNEDINGVSRSRTSKGDRQAMTKIKRTKKKKSFLDIKCVVRTRNLKGDRECNDQKKRKRQTETPKFQ